jgi:metallo-beta-lactamase class B
VGCDFPPASGAASCDILLTPHPGASDLWGRLAERETGNSHALADRTACRRYAERAREGVRTRIEAERKQ